MSLRRSVIGVASSLVGLLRTRLELFGLEAAEEKSRLVKLLAMAFASLLFLTLAVLVITIAIAVAVWPTEQRYLALGCLAGVYALIGVGLLMTVRRLLVHDPAPFAATLDALQQDVAMLERVRVDDDDYDAPGPGRAQER
ncbi:phage holin family protein [Bordetella genomosp. 13]|uniref:phage holin family protein n=1 Tax=Bordetella genomosp. 13 TaxID=463040 RepID=UPI00119EE9E4|nr:phage holin family protein [Bordetella genomosp. 13]